MDESLLERVKSFWLPIVLVIGGLGFVGYGWYAMQEKPKEDILFTAAKDDATDEAAAKAKKQITVDVEGGVEKPGVYRLQATSLMQDALIAAGGMSAHADRAYVAKNINMAAKLIDGAKLYIPLKGESASSGNATTGLNGSQASQININSASQSELDSLPGIGSVTSEKIISGRPYTSIEELTQKKIVGQKVFEQIKDKVVAQ